MFTLNQIQEAHDRVKTGADFPAYIVELQNLQVLAFEIWVTDNHAVYMGTENYRIAGPAIYTPIHIEDTVNKDQFLAYLKIHQKGETDYSTFCQHCAESGILKWIVQLDVKTCTYYDKNENIVYEEAIS